ncbi:hypothetical protein MNBD_GAMMA12-943 [hydrothermal vent metagenome]|uniref:NadR/Ttd14 AAA domain-containing protein n=1 Tax=hydrothermal vent metagenome TaxID=652676 RepID=A0A3B0ZNY9_9ZZZZ
MGGESTLIRSIAISDQAILISEDQWLKSLYNAEIQSITNYSQYSLRLRSIMKSHVQEILKRGNSVVMDFPANTIEQRNWFRDIYSENGFPHKLNYLEVSEAWCLVQINNRRQDNPKSLHFDGAEVFHLITRHFRTQKIMKALN